MIISYKYPIFPNKITQWKLAENLDACRWLYNRLLQYLNEAKEKGIKLKTYCIYPKSEIFGSSYIERSRVASKPS
jgi:hypothetical protein